jgi:hypothetical protein
MLTLPISHPLLNPYKALALALEAEIPNQVRVESETQNPSFVRRISENPVIGKLYDVRSSRNKRLTHAEKCK